MASFVLAYDAHCGWCRRFERAVWFLDARRRIRAVDLDGAERSGLLDSVPVAARHESLHLVSPTGFVWSGSEALGPLFDTLTGHRLVSTVFSRNRLASLAVGVAYGALSRLHDSGSCSLK